jgi:hypothetical protein
MACLVAIDAARNLRAQASSRDKGVFAAAKRFALRRRVSKGQAYVRAQSKANRWEAWARPECGEPGSCCVGISPEYRAACEQRRQRDRALRAARNAANPEVPFFRGYVARQCATGIQSNVCSRARG